MRRSGVMNAALEDKRVNALAGRLCLCLLCHRPVVNGQGGQRARFPTRRSGVMDTALEDKRVNAPAEWLHLGFFCHARARYACKPPAWVGRNSCRGGRCVAGRPPAE